MLVFDMTAEFGEISLCQSEPPLTRQWIILLNRLLPRSSLITRVIMLCSDYLLVRFLLKMLQN